MFPMVVRYNPIFQPEHANLYWECSLRKKQGKSRRMKAIYKSMLSVTNWIVFDLFEQYE